MLARILIIITSLFLYSCLGEEKIKDTAITDASENKETIEFDFTETSPDTVVLKNACTTEKKCNEEFSCIEGICVPTPIEESYIVNYPEEKPTTESPNLDCVENPFEKPIGPEKVMLMGIVDRFGQGRKTIGIRVSVMKLSNFHPEICEQIADSDLREKCFYDYGNPESCPDKKEECMKNIGNPIGWAVSVDPDPSKEDEFYSECTKHLDCGHGFECDVKHKSCLKQYGVYKIDNVPTNTPIVVKAQAVEFVEKWKNTYVYFGYLYADIAEKCEEDEGCEYKYRYNATIVSDGQWDVVPNTMMIGSIKKGNSAIGGRIQDCRIAGNRVSWPMGHVTLNTGNPPVIVGYFTDNEDDALPDPDRKSTDIFGRYAALDIVPGFNRVASAAVVSGKVVSAGKIDLYVLPDTLMIVTFPGRLSYIRK